MPQRSAKKVQFCKSFLIFTQFALIINILTKSARQSNPLAASITSFTIVILEVLNQAFLRSQENLVIAVKYLR
jgi:hypothetical protein